MKFSWNLLSQYKAELYGFSILWIMLFHGIAQHSIGALDRNLSFMTNFIKHGNCGVEVFLFLSGVFLYFSMKNKKSSISFFYRKRVLRIFIPLLLIDGLYWGYLNIVHQHSILRFFKNVTFYSFWFEGNKLVWFIALIVWLYLLYPCIYKFVLRPYGASKKSFAILALLCILVYGGCYILNKTLGSNIHEWYMTTEIALTRIPVFLLGCYVGPLVYQKKNINSWVLICSAAALVWGLYFFYHHFGLVKWYRVQYLLVGPSFAIWGGILLNALGNRYINNTLTFFGTISLELYLSHVLFQKMFFDFSLYGTNKVHNFHLFLKIIFIGAIISALTVSCISKKLITFFSSKSYMDWLYKMLSKE